MTLRGRTPLRQLVDIDLPIRDLIWSGVCLKDNDRISVFVNFSYESKAFDGYTVFRAKEIVRYRRWTYDERRRVKRSGLAALTRGVPLRRMTSMESCLRVAGNMSLISFFTGNDTNSYFVGRLVSFNGLGARFRLVDRTGKYTRYKAIKIDKIDFFSFGTMYERSLSMLNPARQRGF